MVESPSKTMRTVAIAKHKNYGITLSAVSGIALAFFIFWLFKFGDVRQTKINLFVAGFALGPFFGILLSFIFTTILFLVTKITKLKAAYRNIFATVSYSMLPLVISVVFLLPIEIMAFGSYFFGTNPSPYLLKPVPYVVLLILDGLFGTWTLMLLFIGIKILLDVGWKKPLGVMCVSLLIFGFGMRQAIQFLFSLL